MGIDRPQAGRRYEGERHIRENALRERSGPECGRLRGEASPRIVGREAIERVGAGTQYSTLLTTLSLCGSRAGSPDPHGRDTIERNSCMVPAPGSERTGGTLSQLRGAALRRHFS